MPTETADKTSRIKVNDQEALAYGRTFTLAGIESIGQIQPVRITVNSVREAIYRTPESGGGQIFLNLGPVDGPDHRQIAGFASFPEDTLDGDVIESAHVAHSGLTFGGTSAHHLVRQKILDSISKEKGWAFEQQ